MPMIETSNPIRRLWIFSAAAVLLSAATGSSADVTEWAWFRTVTTGTKWWITEGKGDVSVSGGRFDAKLRDSEHPEFVRLSLRGSESGGVVKVRVTVESSDADDFEVSGHLKRFCWKPHGGREIIILTNGADVIGLVRELNPSTPCKPAT